MCDPVHITMATQPQRERFARVAVESLLNQTRPADTLHVEFNGFDAAPTWADELPITYRLWPDNMGAEIRFKRLDEVQGIYLSVDDDMIFPPSYVNYIVEALGRHGGMVGFHGTRYTRYPITSYTHDIERWGFTKGCPSDVAVHQLGAGCMAIHTDTGLRLSEFNEKNMNDCIMARWAARNSVRLTCLTRRDGYIIEQDGSQETGGEIWRAVNRDDRRQTEIVNEALELLNLRHGM